VASAGGAHLRPKFLDNAAPRALEGVFNRLTDIGFALFAIGAAWLCLKVTQESVQLAETDPVLQWQIWPFQVILVVAFGIAVVRHLLYALYPALKPAESGGENAPPSEELVREYAAAQPLPEPKKT
jgi:TRAP-type C4-dicarboxylate transport system permease small subunit